MTLTSIPRNRLRTGAFTLVEVALSLGIAAVCLMTLLAMLPFGLDTLRTSANRQAEARMSQTIVSYYQMTTWVKQTATGSRSINLVDRTFFFDQTGTEITSATHPDRAYVVDARVIPSPPTLNGDGESNQYLRQLRLRFTDRADYVTAFQEGSGQYRDRPAWIVNIEQTGPLTTVLAALPAK